MKGALVVGGTPHPFSLSYDGPSTPQTEKLARNLRKYAEQMKASPRRSSGGSARRVRGALVIPERITRAGAARPGRSVGSCIALDSDGVSHVRRLCTLKVGRG